MKKAAALLLALLPALLLAALAAPPAWASGHREGTTVRPEHFLRAYDPITVVFEQPRGPSGGGPLDDPSGVMELIPDHPGEYRWLDERTLQFLPATAWPPLREYEIETPGGSWILSSLMLPPSNLQPAGGSRDLGPIRDFTLTFPDRIPPADLARMISFEVKPLPGVGGEPGRQLTEQDFSVKELDRTAPDQPSRYLVSLDEPVGYGRHVDLRLRLSLNTELDGSLVTYGFETRSEFRLTGVGCGYVSYPVASNGSVYTLDQAIDCGTGTTPLFLEFSESLAGPDIEQVKALVRFEPAVEDLSFQVSGNRLYLSFAPRRGEPYRLVLRHQELESSSGRRLAPLGRTSLHLYYRQSSPYLRWQRGQAIAERYGPKYFPMEGRATERVDLRIYRIDPLDRDFWPFPVQPLEIDESSRPPMPGEEPEPATRLAEQLRLLGSPGISEIIEVPSEAGRGRIRFGLNIEPYLNRLAGHWRPGAYLVGIRSIGPGAARSYVRLLVTDLSLSTVEEEHAVTFVVTSLRTGEPVEGAAVRVEAEVSSLPEGRREWRAVIRGRTDSAGRFRYEHTRALDGPVRRIVVSRGEDHLVLDPAHPPPHFQNNHWFASSSDWLSWLSRPPRREKARPRQRAFLLTERPLYRPEEPVHIMGYVRIREQGSIRAADPSRKRTLIVDGPGKKYFSFPVTLSPSGQFHLKFHEENLPTGSYLALLRDEESGRDLASVSFRKEAYRIPRFETQISGPDRVPMDRPFQLELTADYYAGGRLVGQPVTWNVTQYPYFYQPPDYPGFVFSTDERFAGDGRFRSSGSKRKEEVTDSGGSARLDVNPAIEEDGRPRLYIVEATVRGADAQTVTTVKQVVAVPAFVLGLKTPRLLRDTRVIEPEIVVLDHNDEPAAGRRFTLRLYHRQWHSYLKETDFTTGEAQYITDVVDELLVEDQHVSRLSPMTVRLPVQRAGVYVVELLAQDALGRLQQVQTDLYVAADTPVAWEKSKANVLEIVTDRNRYAPGEEAVLLLKSPYQEARALMVVEGPRANRYSWLEVTGGQALFRLRIDEDMAPAVPVHALLLRGRLPGTGIRLEGREDRGKPQAVAGTAWVAVDPEANRARLSLEHETVRLPGDSMTVTLRLSDPDGRPLDGEAALWLVDRAVLALGDEKSIDPLPAFIDPAVSHIRIRETRNEVVGNIPAEELPGGADYGAERSSEPASLMDRTTVRRSFETVPYFNPAVRIEDGYAEVTIDLPDNLTEFAVRAVAVAGPDRFGTAKSAVSIRLPVIVQSALPRFVRPGDRFTAGGIGRVVEGPGGAGRVQIQVEGLELDDPRAGGPEGRSVSDSLEWDPAKPQRLFFPMAAPESLTEDDRVTVRMAVERTADHAGDGFQIELPVRRDTRSVRLDTFTATGAGQTLAFPFPEEPVRPGATVQKLILTREPAIFRLIGAMNMLIAYEHLCTEQRISELMPALALRDVLSAVGLPEAYPVESETMEDLFTYLDSALGDDGLYSFWPGSRGYVSLTAYVVEFLVRARESGYTFPDELLDRPLGALQEALRSDYRRFVSGHAFRERVEALAALARAGRYDEAYGQDLLAGALQSDLYGQARILSLFLELSQAERDTVKRLESGLWQSAVFKMREGREVFAGLDYRSRRWGGLVLSSRIKTLAEVISALHRCDPASPRVRLMLDDLVARGDADGWGSTNANSSALLALGQVLDLSGAAGDAADGGAVFEAVFDGRSERIRTEGRAVSVVSVRSDVPGELRLIERGNAAPPHAWLSVSYVPGDLGDSLERESRGFAVERELLTVGSDGAVTGRRPAAAGQSLAWGMDAVVEEHVRVNNPEDRNFVAVRVPFAAGFEPLNPQLATAPPEAAPSGRITRRPSYTLYGDDHVTFYYDELPAGTYDFYFRLRAGFEGSFTHPPARAEMMYDAGVFGRSDGTRIVIHGQPEGTGRKDSGGR